MMKYCRMTLFVFSVLLACVRDSAQAQDNADAEFLSVVHTYELLPDGSNTYTYQHSLKYLTNYAFTRAYGESFIIYDPQWQKLEINRSETTMRNGQKISSPLNAFNEVLPGYAAKATPYLRMREMVVTHVGLEAGCTVDFAYTITTKKGFMPGLSGKVLFGGRSPIHSLTVHVIVPPEVKMEHEIVGMNTTPSVRNENSKTIYTWSIDNLPLAEVEAAQPPLHEFVPYLLFSTASYSDVSAHILSDRKLFDATSQMMTVATEQIKDCQNQTERALALRRWVADHTARMTAPLADIGMRPLNAAMTFDKCVGSDLDRAVLLVALCRAVKLDADVVLTTSGDTPPLPTAHALSKPLVLCRDNSYLRGFLFLDPQNTPIGIAASMAGLSSYLTLSSTVHEVVAVPFFTEQTKVSLTSDWTLDKEMNINGRSAVVTEGLRSYDLDPAGLKKVVTKALLDAAQGLKVTMDEPRSANGSVTTCEAEISSGKALTHINGVVRFVLPSAPLGISDFGFIPSDVRRSTPIELHVAMNEENRMTLHLPGGIVSLHTGKTELTNSIGSVRVEIIGDEAEVEINRSITFYSRRARPDQFEELKALLSIWRDPKHTVLFLKLK